jgi:hypothetical protein
MHWEKASMGFVDWEFAEPPACDAPPEPVDDELPLLHAAASRARTAVAMRAAAVRAGRGDARRGRRLTRVLSFILVSSAAWWWLRPAAGVQSGLAASRFMGCSVRHGPRRRGPPRSSRQPMTGAEQ